MAAQNTKSVVAKVAATTPTSVTATPRFKPFKVTNAHQFSVLSWNVLAQVYIDPPRYGTIKPQYLEWKYRLPLILKQIRAVDADVVCLQEVEIAAFEPDFARALAADGYTGVLQNDPKRASGHPTGNATFFKRNKFRAVWVDSRSRSVITALQFLQPIARPADTTSVTTATATTTAVSTTPATVAVTSDAKVSEQASEPPPSATPPPAPAEYLYVCNVHLEGHPEKVDVRIQQVSSSLKNIHKKQTEVSTKRMLPAAPTPVATTATTDSKAAASATAASDSKAESSASAGSSAASNAPDAGASRVAPENAYTIICGDFNETYTEGAVSHLLNKGFVEAGQKDRYLHLPVTKVRIDHSYSLGMAYPPEHSGETGAPEWSFIGMGMALQKVQSVLDFVYYSQPALRLCSRMTVTPDTAAERKAYVDSMQPSQHHPSDHFPVAALFERMPTPLLPPATLKKAVVDAEAAALIAAAKRAEAMKRKAEFKATKKAGGKSPQSVTPPASQTGGASPQRTPPNRTPNRSPKPVATTASADALVAALNASAASVLAPSPTTVTAAASASASSSAAAGP